jgi:hypothetical protein
MSESHQFQCQTCGFKLDFPSNFEGQTKVCLNCEFETVLKKINIPQAATNTPVRIELPPETQSPTAVYGVSKKEDASLEAVGQAPPFPSTREPEGKPTKVQAITVFLCIGGPFNILLGLFYLIAGIVSLVGNEWTGLGVLVKMGVPLAIVEGVFLVTIGAFLVLCAFQHFKADSRPKHSFVKLVGILQIVSVLGIFTCITVVFGILTLIFLTDERVKEYYE